MKQYISSPAAREKKEQLLEKKMEKLRSLSDDDLKATYINMSLEVENERVMLRFLIITTSIVIFLSIWSFLYGQVDFNVNDKMAVLEITTLFAGVSIIFWLLTKIKACKKRIHDLDRKMEFVIEIVKGKRNL